MANPLLLFVLKEQTPKNASFQGINRQKKFFSSVLLAKILAPFAVLA
jgi:hypothetical protein